VENVENVVPGILDPMPSRPEGRWWELFPTAGFDAFERLANLAGGLFQLADWADVAAGLPALLCRLLALLVASLL